MATFDRGLKKHCEQIVTSVREELELAEYQPIDMVSLASNLAIPLVRLEDQIRASGLVCDDLLVEQIYKSVSAYTSFEGTHRTVVCNERHPLPRHRSNLAHEFAHALLHHPAEGTTGNKETELLYEKEAIWLSGVLMLTEKQALHVAKSRTSVDQAVTHYQISREMLQYRLNVTAAIRRAGP